MRKPAIVLETGRKVQGGWGYRQEDFILRRILLLFDDSGSLHFLLEKLDVPWTYWLVSISLRRFCSLVRHSSKCCLILPPTFLPRLTRFSVGGRVQLHLGYRNTRSRKLHFPSNHTQHHLNPMILTSARSHINSIQKISWCHDIRAPSPDIQ